MPAKKPSLYSDHDVTRLATDDAHSKSEEARVASRIAEPGSFPHVSNAINHSLKGNHAEAAKYHQLAAGYHTTAANTADADIAVAKRHGGDPKFFEDRRDKHLAAIKAHQAAAKAHLA